MINNIVDNISIQKAPNIEEKIEEKTNYAKSVKNKNRFLIACITIFAVFVCLVTAFVSLQSVMPENLILNLQCCFILPLPIQFLLIVIFSIMWAKRYLKIISISCLIWSILLSIFTTAWIISGSHYPLIFAIGIPAQIITLMSFGIIDVKTLRAKYEKTDEKGE